jgi:hypothetical protein
MSLQNDDSGRVIDSLHSAMKKEGHHYQSTFSCMKPWLSYKLQAYNYHGLDAALQYCTVFQYPL